MPKHWEFPYRTSVHCRGFAPAAPRRARVSVSVPFSGLPLSRPVLILGLVVRYTANSLISRQLILGHCFSAKKHSSIFCPSRFTFSFPKLSETQGQIIDVLLSIPPGLLRALRLAWLNRSPIAAIFRRINGNFCNFNRKIEIT